MYLSRVRLRPQISATQLPQLLQDRKGYGLHRLFWGLFSEGQGDPQQRDFLFREEVAGEQLNNPGRRRADPIYYVLSKRAPKMDSPLFEVETKAYSPQLGVGDRLAFKLRVNAVVTRDKKRHDIVMDSQSGWLREQLQGLELDALGDKGECKKRLLDHAGDQQLQHWRALIGEGLYQQQLDQQLGRSELLEWSLKTIQASRIEAWWLRQGERHGFEVGVNGAGESLLDFARYQKNPLPEKGKLAGFNSLDLAGEVIVRDVVKFEQLLLQGTGPAKAFGCGLMMIRRL
jgi:CRISPR system Cascade subunit CasE